MPWIWAKEKTVKTSSMKDTKRKVQGTRCKESFRPCTSVKKERSNKINMETMNETNQYLPFELDEKVFALDIRKVREVREYSSVTKVPQTPP